MIHLSVTLPISLSMSLGMGLAPRTAHTSPHELLCDPWYALVVRISKHLWPRPLSFELSNPTSRCLLAASTWMSPKAFQTQYPPSNLLLLLQVDGPSTIHWVTVVGFRQQPKLILDFSFFLGLYIQATTKAFPC